MTRNEFEASQGEERQLASFWEHRAPSLERSLALPSVVFWFWFLVLAFFFVYLSHTALLTLFLVFDIWKQRKDILYLHESNEP